MSAVLFFEDIVRETCFTTRFAFLFTDTGEEFVDKQVFERAATAYLLMEIGREHSTSYVKEEGTLCVCVIHRFIRSCRVS